MTDKPTLNTDRELWREQSHLPADPDNYYAPSIHVTALGGIGINVGGTVIVKTLRQWHAIADRNPQGGDAVAAPSSDESGGGEANRPTSSQVNP